MVICIVMGQKTKILYVITKSNWGGAQKYVYELATNLPKDKYEVAVVLGGDGSLAQKLDKQNIRTIHLVNLERDIILFKELSVFWSLIKVFKKEQPDVIHLNSSKIGGLGALAGRVYNLSKLLTTHYKLPTKIIFTAHGFAYNEDRPWFVKIILFLLNYLTILWSHKTIVINQREFNQVKNLPFIKNKLGLIYIGVGGSKIVRIEKKPGGPLSIGTVSELTKNKGLAYVVEAIAKLKNRNITFSIIGEGEERKNLEKLIGERNLANKVKLLGFKENAASYLDLFDIFTLTSVKEGLPYTILEAGLAGLPVIASDVGGVGEIIENNESGILVGPKNVEQIVEALNLLVENKELRKKFGENLKKTVERKFSLKQMFAMTVGVYKNDQL